MKKKGYKMRGSVQVAGSPGYRISEDQIQDRLYRYGMDNTPAGAQIKKNMQKIRSKYKI